MVWSWRLRSLVVGLAFTWLVGVLGVWGFASYSGFALQAMLSSVFASVGFGAGLSWGLSVAVVVAVFTVAVSGWRLNRFSIVAPLVFLIFSAVWPVYVSLFGGGVLVGLFSLLQVAVAIGGGFVVAGGSGWLRVSLLLLWLSAPLSTLLRLLFYGGFGEAPLDVAGLMSALPAALSASLLMAGVGCVRGMLAGLLSASTVLALLLAAWSGGGLGALGLAAAAAASMVSVALAALWGGYLRLLSRS